MGRTRAAVARGTAAGSRRVGEAVQNVEPDQDLPRRAERGRAISELPWAEIAYPGVEDRITIHQQVPMLRLSTAKRSGDDAHRAAVLASLPRLKRREGTPR